MRIGEVIAWRSERDDTQQRKGLSPIDWRLSDVHSELTERNEAAKVCVMNERGALRCNFVF